MMDELEIGGLGMPTTPLEEIPRSGSVSPWFADFPFAATEGTDLLERARRAPRRLLVQVDEARRRGRELSERVLRPAALEVERRVAADPEYFAWDVMRRACDARMLSLMIPAALGGSDYATLPMAVLIEELAVGCAGLASTIGVHNVAAGLIPDPYLLEKYVQPIVWAERRGEPVLFSGAITEPNAGTDIWDEQFLARARIGTFAEPCPGGYRLNGRKCFISNGNVARWTLLAAATDRRDVPGTWSLFLVPLGIDGFSVGRVERKMGQKASPAAELIFEDAVLPAEMRVGHPGAARRLVSIYLAGSRGPVGAIGVGCARRALEAFVDWACRHRMGGRPAIDHQWVQLQIAEMSRDIHVARQAYVAACLLFDEILAGLYGRALVRATLGLLPRALVVSESGRQLLQSKPVRRLVWSYLGQAAPDDTLAHASLLSTIAKILGSDAGVRVSSAAMRIMGADAFDPRWPVEKCFRDAKLTQIYEGTNQANAVTQLKAMVANGGRRFRVDADGMPVRERATVSEPACRSPRAQAA